MPEYMLEIVTEPTGEAMDEALRGEIIQRLGDAEAGHSLDGHLGIRMRVWGDDPESALREGLQLFRDVIAELFGLQFRVRKVCVGPPSEFEGS
jgi:hypothetical protein